MYMLISGFIMIVFIGMIALVLGIYFYITEIIRGIPMLILKQTNLQGLHDMAWIKTDAFVKVLAPTLAILSMVYVGFYYM